MEPEAPVALRLRALSKSDSLNPVSGILGSVEVVVSAVGLVRILANPAFNAPLPASYIVLATCIWCPPATPATKPIEPAFTILFASNPPLALSSPEPYCAKASSVPSSPNSLAPSTTVAAPV